VVGDQLNTSHRAAASELLTAAPDRR